MVILEYIEPKPIERPVCCVCGIDLFAECTDGTPAVGRIYRLEWREWICGLCKNWAEIVALEAKINAGLFDGLVPVPRHHTATGCDCYFCAPEPMV